MHTTPGSRTSTEALRRRRALAERVLERNRLRAPSHAMPAPTPTATPAGDRLGMRSGNCSTSS